MEVPDKPAVFVLPCLYESEVRFENLTEGRRDSAGARSDPQILREAAAVHMGQEAAPCLGNTDNLSGAGALCNSDPATAMILLIYLLPRTMITGKKRSISWN